ncbi:uncharacterized protein LOC129718052 isoform X2 [Wyeomyia smithii]|uniref:uncharacterized protein LOC129718052 isoform X2 n=1 Tax=Wyeomyia smithii TaxID=174621 RepID=UPI002467D0BB|nr:uncharacterized protein LOC129718052 isoform X2 [Wyeomyia smithii]
MVGITRIEIHPIKVEPVLIEEEEPIAIEPMKLEDSAMIQVEEFLISYAQDMDTEPAITGNCRSYCEVAGCFSDPQSSLMSPIVAGQSSNVPQSSEKPHLVAQKKYVCCVCKEGFASKRYLTTHIREHIPAKGFIEWDFWNEALFKASIGESKSEDQREETAHREEHEAVEPKKPKKVKSASGSCIYEADQFCFVCGKYLSAKATKFSVKNNEMLKKAYSVYFESEITDLEKPWVPGYVLLRFYNSTYLAKTGESRR